MSEKLPSTAGKFAINTDRAGGVAFVILSCVLIVPPSTIATLGIDKVLATAGSSGIVALGNNPVASENKFRI